MAKPHYVTLPSFWALVLPMTVALTGSFPQSVEAREDTRHPIDIAASTLPHAIAELARQTGVSIGTEGQLPAYPTQAVHGAMSVEAALDHLLAGSGLEARKVGPNAWRIERTHAKTIPPRAPTASASPPPPEIASVPIIVTASKRKQDLYSLPRAVALVELPRFETNVLQGSESVARHLEGIALTGQGAGRNRMFLRGISDSAFNGESQATVAVVLDDARLTYSAPDPDIRLIDMERVEILKGPQGSLYGTGALGGIYHIVSNRPALDQTDVVISGGGQAFSAGDAGYSLSGIVNLPVVSDVAGVRLVGYSAIEPGWIDTGERTNSNSLRVAGLRAGVGVQATLDWRIDLTGFAQWLESRDSSYVYGPHNQSRSAQQAEPHDNDLRHLAVRLERQGGPVNFVASSAVTWHEVGDTINATIGADSFGVPDPRLLFENRNYRVVDSEARFDGTLGSLKWLGGISWVDARQHLQTDLQGAAQELNIDDDLRRTSDIAAFGDAIIPLGHGFSLDAGARLYRSNTRDIRIFRTGEYHVNSTRTGATPSLAVSWQRSESQFLWLRYGSAFRQGGSDIGVDGVADRLKGDELAMIEVGWRIHSTGGARLELGAWYGWWENLQSDQLQANGLIETGNAGNAVTWGAEASGSIPTGNSWLIEAGGNFTMAKLTCNTLGYELADSHLPGVPEYTLRGSVRHDLQIGKPDVSIKLSLRYVGPSHLSFDPVTDRRMGNLLESSLEAQAVLGMMTFRFGIDNMFGASADTFAYGNSLRFATMRQYTPQAPTRLTVSVSQRF